MSEEELKEKVEELAEAKQTTEEPDKVSEVEEQLNQLKEANDKVEAELLRKEELRAKVAMGGKADAGEPEETEEEKADKEASKILSTFEAE